MKKNKADSKYNSSIINPKYNYNAYSTCINYFELNKLFSHFSTVG